MQLKRSQFTESRAANRRFKPSGCRATEPLERRMLLSSTLSTVAALPGESPTGSLTLSGSILYGTTSNGGANGDGTVFSVPTTGGSPTVLASFSGSDGESPNGGLVLSDGILYGTTTNGGANGEGGEGTVFSVPLTGGSPTVLASFNGSNGESPNGNLVLSQGILYGTAGTGGANGEGTVFSLPITGGSPAVLALFNGSSGEGPSGLTLSGSTLYGTTYTGYTGGTGGGTVFSLPLTGGTPTVLASFNGDLIGGLTLSGSTLYGTTAWDDTVFSVPTSGGSSTVLASLSDSDGELLNGGLTLSDNTLYGTTFAGTAGNSVFSVPITGGSPSLIASLDGNVSGGLAVDSNGDLFGTSVDANGDGTIFEVASAAAPSLPDLQLANVSYTAGAYQAGSALSINGTQENTGTASAGAYQVEAVLSTDQTFGDANNIPLGTIDESGLGAGDSSSFTIQGTIPASTPPGNYYVLTMIDSGNGVAESNETNNVFTSSSADVTVEPPPTPYSLGGKNPKILSYTDASGTSAQVALSGAGTATLAFSGTDISEQTSTALRPSIAISPEINGGGLQPHSQAPRITVSGSALELTEIDLAGTNASTNLSISSGGEVTLGTLSDPGSIGTIAASGAGLTGTMTVGGTAGSVTFQAAAGSISAGTLKKLAITDNCDANLSCGSLGNVTAGSIGLGYGNPLTWDSSGTIGTVIAGSMTDTDLESGIGPGSSGGIGASFATHSSIASVIVNGAFTDSFLSASFIARAKLGSVASENGGTPFGLVAKRVGQLSATIDGTPLKAANLSTNAAVTNVFANSGVTPNDFVIDII